MPDLQQAALLLHLSEVNLRQSLGSLVYGATPEAASRIHHLPIVSSHPSLFKTVLTFCFRNLFFRLTPSCPL